MQFLLKSFKICSKVLLKKLRASGFELKVVGPLFWDRLNHLRMTGEKRNAKSIINQNMWFSTFRERKIALTLTTILDFISIIQRKHIFWI
jgi:hypothetical protein